MRKRLMGMTKEAYYYISKTESLKAIASQFHILLMPEGLLIWYHFNRHKPYSLFSEPEHYGAEL